MKFPHINDRGPNFVEKPFLENGWIICSLLLYYDLESFKDPNSSSLIRFKFSLHDSIVLFLSFLKVPQTKEGGPNCLGELILENSQIIWSLLLYYNLKKFKDPNSLSFNRFEFIVHDSAVLFFKFFEISRTERGGPNSLGQPILLNCWIIWFPLFYFNFKNF